MKVSVDADKCVAAGQCVLLAPEVFDQREEDDDAVREAAMVCPASAIHLNES